MQTKESIKNTQINRKLSVNAMANKLWILQSLSESKTQIYVAFYLRLNGLGKMKFAARTRDLTRINDRTLPLLRRRFSTKASGYWPACVLQNILTLTFIIGGIT